jgi:hypothetical protein
LTFFLRLPDCALIGATIDHNGTIFAIASQAFVQQREVKLMIRTPIRFAAVCAAALLLGAASANANIFRLEAELEGLQVVPPNKSPATGLVEVTLDNASGLFTVISGSYQGLLGNSLAVSLNDAPVGVNGLTALSLTIDSPGDMTGTFSGSGTLTAAKSRTCLAVLGTSWFVAQRLKEVKFAANSA